MLRLRVSHNLGLVQTQLRRLETTLDGESSAVRGWLYQGAQEQAERVRDRQFFYSREVTPSPRIGSSGRAFPRGSRSRGAARSSVRALRPSQARARGYTAGVIGGDLPGTTHLRALELGRRRRTRSPGATGPLPPQHIFRRGARLFSGHGLRAFARAARQGIAARFRIG